VIEKLNRTFFDDSNLIFEKLAEKFEEIASADVAVADLMKNQKTGFDWQNVK
jgi:hypothetical protein